MSAHMNLARPTQISLSRDNQRHPNEQRRGAYTVRPYNVLYDADGQQLLLAYPHIEMLDFVAVTEPSRWWNADEHYDASPKVVARFPVGDVLRDLKYGEQSADFKLLCQSLQDAGVDLRINSIFALKMDNEGLRIDHEVQSQFDLAGLMREALLRLVCDDYKLVLTLRETWLGSRHGAPRPDFRDACRYKPDILTPDAVFPIRRLSFDKPRMRLTPK